VDPVAVTWAIAILFFVLALVAATHDIAIDGYYLEALDKEGQSRFVGFRAMAYRIAIFVVSSPVFILIDRSGWFVTLLVVALLMLLITLYHVFFLPRVESPELSFGDLFRTLVTMRALAFGVVAALGIATIRKVILSQPIQEMVTASPVLSRISTAGWIGLALLFALLVLLALIPLIGRRLAHSSSHYAHAFIDFLDQPRIGIILGFVVCLRTGESFLLKMRYAFLRDIGMTPEQFGYANGIAIWATIISTMVGGYLISRHGLKRWIWPFVLAQNGLNLLYMVIAGKYEHLIGHPELGVPSFSLLAVVIIGESFGAGLGTAVFMVYLMRCCKSHHKAAHYAILSALMSVSFTISGVLSGFLASSLGFGSYFGFTFLATIPGMVLIFFLPYLDDTCAADLDSEESTSPS
jgi:PAT family beta-lactamase induction signal transducer AmpG